MEDNAYTRRFLTPPEDAPEPAPQPADDEGEDE